MTTIRQRLEEKWTEIEAIRKKMWPRPTFSKDRFLRAAWALARFIPEMPTSRTEVKRGNRDLDKVRDRTDQYLRLIDELSPQRKRQLRTAKLSAELRRVRDASWDLYRSRPSPPERPGGFEIRRILELKKEAVRLMQDIVEGVNVSNTKLGEFSAILFYVAFNLLSGSMRDACAAVKNEGRRRRGLSASR
jgi:hypothetical protein